MPSRVATLAAIPVLALAGLLLGAAGSFAQAIRLDVVGVELPVGLVAVLAVNAAVFLGGARALGRRLGAAAPALGWFVAVLLLSSRRPEGDLVLPADAGSYAYLLLGTIVAGLAVGLPAGQPAGSPPEQPNRQPAGSPAERR